MYFVHVCERLEHAPFLRADGSEPDCPFRAFESLARKHLALLVQQGSSEPYEPNPSAEASTYSPSWSSDLALPVSRTTCLRVLREMWELDHHVRVYYSPLQQIPVAMRAWVPTSISAVQPFPVVREQWETWERWLANLSASAPHPSLRVAFHTGGGGWVLMETAEELSESAR